MDSARSQQLGNEKPQDWLIDNSGYKAEIVENKSRNEVSITNGLIERQFRIHPNPATVGLRDLTTDQSLVRAVKPEAIITIDGNEYKVGGLTGQPNLAYLKSEWLDQMKKEPGSLKFLGTRTPEIEPRFDWKRVRHHAPDAHWPPKGVRLAFAYSQPDTANAPSFEVIVNYELYDGIPVICKWLEITNKSSKPITINRFTSELLGLVEHTSRVESREGVKLPRPQSIHVETDFAFGGFTPKNANRHVVRWRTDPDYSTQVNYLKQQPCLLEVSPTYGPEQVIEPNKSFETYRTFELVFDSTERERRSLALRKMYRTIAPWTTENPLMHHMRLADPEKVRIAIDEAAEVGFEMVILSFGSGFNIENRDANYVRQWKEIVDYARTKNIELGGYSLLSSRRIGNGNDIVSPKGQKPTHGSCPALTSEWGINYYKNLYEFYETTGFAVLEHDGPYPGDVDVTARPPLQKGEADSRWAQWRIASDFYKWCRANGIYLNTPDYYYLVGSNKCGMGYRETNWSLPREMQLIHTRQNIFDGTWEKTPSMGWMFVPLTEYHGGGAAATIEPLSEHIDHYQQMIQSNLGLGVQACYRGPRLFDSEKTKAMVKNQVEWFKKYRDILESDVIHGRRADGQDLDWMLHVNPSLQHKGMLLVYNPLDQPIEKRLTVNLYYTGIDNKAIVADQEGAKQTLELHRDYSVEIPVHLEPNSMKWFTVENADE